MKSGKIRLTVRELRIAIRESLLREELPTSRADNPDMLENDSIDAQVDRLLLQGDKSKEDTGATQAESLLREADEDAPPPDAAPADAGGDAPPPPQNAAPEKQLDVMAFADNVARLVEKLDNLIDVKGTLVRRALNYVTKNYDPKQAKEVQQVLEGNFELSPEAHADGYDDNDNVPPNAKGAGAGLNG